MELDHDERNVLGTFIAIAIMLGVVLACSGGDETEKANKLVDEGNSAVQDGKKFMTDAQEKITTMMGTDFKHLADARQLPTRLFGFTTKPRTSARPRAQSTTRPVS